MIYFEKLGRMGRLGNQLFQYAALRGLCLKHGYRAVIPDLSERSCHGQVSLLNEFNISADVYNGERGRHKMKEASWRAVDKRFNRLRDNSIIEGYFQSIYYFKDYQDIIKRELTPNGEHVMKNVKYMLDLRAENEFRPIISVHLRRGDNMTWTNSHNYTPAYEADGVYWDYFMRAREVFSGMDAKFLIFTGGSRGEEDNSKDMEWCRKMFIGEEYLFSDAQNPIDDLTRIMFCDHNILSHVSSFGWWGAYLNRNPSKKVVAPESYHPEEPSLKRYMFYPDEYILV